jgi:DNA-directed RNA polymerase subunit RPC12/RpoP
MSYLVCGNCGYRIPLSDYIRSETTTLTCPNCGSRSFTLYIDPNDFQTINYLIALVLVSYVAPLIYYLQEKMKSINEESKEAEKRE